MRVAAAVVFVLAGGTFAASAIYVWPKYSYRNNRRLASLGGAVLCVGLALVALAR